MVVVHVGVDGCDVLDRELRAGGDRAGLEAALHAWPGHREVGDRRRAHHPQPLGVRGHDVGDVAAVRDDAVHLVAGAQVLAQQADRHLRDGDRVGGVDAEVRCGGRVRRDARRSATPKCDDRAHPGREVLERRRVHHHRRVHARERAPLEQEHLAAAALLGRRADDADLQVEVVDERREREPGADRGRRDDVVPARVPDAGQRVVLGADREVQRTGADPARERGRQVADAGVDREARVGEHARGPGARPDLLELQLGMRVHAVTEPDECLCVRLRRFHAPRSWHP